MAVENAARDLAINEYQDHSFGGESLCKACGNGWTSLSEPRVQEPADWEPSPFLPGPLLPLLERYPEARILLNALPISVCHCTTVFCVAVALVVMFSVALALQVYIMRNTTYHDSVLFQTDDDEDPPSAHHVSLRPSSPPKLEPTRPWKINPVSASRPLLSSDRFHIYWQYREMPDRSDPDYEWQPMDTTTTRPQFIRDFPLLPARDYMGRRKSVCMFHAAGSGRMRNGIRYKAWTFPYHLCTHVVYCCSGISKELKVTSKYYDVDIGEGSLATFTSMKERNPHLRIYIGLGGEDRDHEGFSRIADSIDARQQFAQAVTDWIRLFRFDGMVLYWRFPFLDQKDKVVDMMRNLRRMLLRANLTTGLVVPLDALLRERFNILELARILDDYTILVDPTEVHGVAYDSTFVPLRDSTVGTYAGLFMRTLENVHGQMRDGRFKLCYLLPVHALSFTLEESAQAEIGAPTRGPGEPGVSTDQPGLLSYDEVCGERWDRARRVNYGVIGTRVNQWVVFQNRSSLRELITQLGLVTGSAKCIGVWDPSWDDFSGFCGEGPYPLTRAVFSKVIGRRILPFTTTKSSYIL
ncbi:chitinase, putative [Ixodes scapularis]|uniref:Chitinase, putative n=1 Tax=Ixodes scapularis TaxID=6945 RepID=B7PKU7_IXOSC|nr:chitinase, putative [Ixodes scapularis]|eukprot:XP_002434395.1 chitinase, putative [Ixodes scapularis]